MTAPAAEASPPTDTAWTVRYVFAGYDPGADDGAWTVRYVFAPGTAGGLTAAFRRDEARDEHGRWTRTGGGAARKAVEHAEREAQPELAGYELWKSDQGKATATPEQAQAAARIWYSGNAIQTDRWLRDGTTPATPATFSHDSAAFTGLIRHSAPFTQPAVMWRGINGAEQMFGPPGTAKGRRFTDWGLVSATAAEDTALTYGESLIRLHVPVGAHALRADQGIWDAAGNTQTGYEMGSVQEYTLPPGSQFEVTGETTEHIRYANRRVLDVTLLPDEPPAPAAAGQARAAAAQPAKGDGPDGLPGGDRFAWRPGDIRFHDDAPRAAARFDPAKHPRGIHGEWATLDLDGMDRMLQSEFRPARLDAARVKHPRSGYMVETGIERRVSRPPEPDHPLRGADLGPEGPATFDLRDYGDPTKPGYNSLEYMGGKKAGTEPIAHVYRGMSQAEWDQARERGYLQSDARGDISALEGTNAAADPRDAVSYLPNGPGVLAKIAVRPEDKWFTIGADDYLRTREKIPLDRVEHTVQVTRGGKYANEYRALLPRRLAPAAAGRFDPAKHPRGYHGWFGHGTGPARKTRVPSGDLDSGDRQLIAAQLDQWAKVEKDANHKTALGMVSDDFKIGNYNSAAYRLRLIADDVGKAGRQLDADQMHTIAGLIDKLEPGPPLTPPPEKHPGQFRAQLTKYWQDETDPEAKQALNQAGAAYDDNQYDMPADLIRSAAGRVGPLGRHRDALKYDVLADAIEQQGQDNGISHTTQALNALGTETDATNYGDVADQLSNARRAIEAAQAGTSWRTQAADYLQAAATLANGHRDYAAAHRYDHLASRVIKLPETQAPGNPALAAFLTKTAAAVPGLLGGGDQRFTGKAATFTPQQQPDYLGFTYPDGHIELRTDVVKGLLGVQEHPGQVMPEPDNLDVVLHEEIHDTTGGRTEQDKKAWDALPKRDRDLLNQVAQMDSESVSGGAYPVAHTLADISARDFGRTTQAEIDSLTKRGLLTQADFSNVGPQGGREHLWMLTPKARSQIPNKDTAADDEYTSDSGHDIEEGFTELGATQHMEQFAASQGFGQVMTPRLTVAPIGNPPTLKQVLDVQNDLRDLYDAAGKVAGQPGALEAYTALDDAIHEMQSGQTDLGAFARHLARALRAEPDPLIRKRIDGLIRKLGITGGGTVDNPAYDRAKTDLLAGLRAEQRKLKKDGRPPQAQAAQHLAVVITDVKNDLPDQVGDVLDEIQHLGDSARAADVKTLRGKLDTLTATPAARHDTVPEYAHDLADPAKLASSTSWGHYPDLTANAQQWVQSVARAEHKTGFTKQGTPGYKRVVELTDEINRENTNGKITAMTRQVLRSMGIDPDTASGGLIRSVRDEIIAKYGDVGSPSQGAAAAWKAARRVARQAQQGYQEQGGIMRKWSAAAADDAEPGVLPVAVTLTPAGAKAARIRARAWKDPQHLARAIAQVRQLATATTDPAALRQVQDAGRSLRMLAAIRQPAPDTAAAFDPHEDRDPHTGRWAGGDAQGRFFHGTRNRYRPGQELSDKIHYYTGYRPLAASYAQGATEHGPPRVYQVEPVEGHERDPEYPDTGEKVQWPPGGAWRARKIRVIREVSHSEMPAAAAWDPRKHPRRPDGKFGHGPGTPRKPRHTTTAPGAVSGPLTPAAVAAALDKAIKSGHPHATKPGEHHGFRQPTNVNYFGNTNDTSIVTFGDGSKWVRKRGLDTAGLHHEIAYSRYAGALGIPAPVAVQHPGPDGKPELYEPYVNGQTAIEWAGGYDPEEEYPARKTPLPGRDPARLYKSPEGRMIGLADMTANSEERHLGNWIVTHDEHGDHPVPIDNDHADFGQIIFSITPFADYDLSDLKAEHTAAEWDQWQANLEGLHPEFTQLGMDTEWGNLMANLREARRQAYTT
jgi:hypothetical protein